MSLNEARLACANDPSASHHVEVYVRAARVRRVLGVRQSESGLHEGFIFAPLATNQLYRVEDNADITGIIPLYRGDMIELQGQYECDDGVIHWTHHDPAGRHISGFIKVHGRTYQ